MSKGTQVISLGAAMKVMIAEAMTRPKMNLLRRTLTSLGVEASSSSLMTASTLNPAS